MDKEEPLYEVLTWDTEQQAFTPQNGLPPNPFTWIGLLHALRALRNIGYETRRADAHSVLVQRVDETGEPCD